jgi:hypothetical protein
MEVGINKKSIKISPNAFAVWTGLEPATSAVTGRHSNQLNYQTKLDTLFKGDAKVGLMDQKSKKYK